MKTVRRRGGESLAVVSERGREVDYETMRD